ncbi:uncharacterized protein LOC126769718 [Nymphalis io]|uniref:uncharacterized protein LOC126769718 n=1 Tax=Inachis io TaxID=171585 RepID=UPI0021689A0B|nr:uncharacterized protein LOC126769718 [Nymphalis io]
MTSQPYRNPTQTRQGRSVELPKKKQRKRYWVHPYLQTRDETKHFEIFFGELKNYEDKFFRYTRMSLKSFEELLSILRTCITKQDTQFRNSIKPELKLTIVLRYLATGCSFAELHYVFRVGVSTVAEIVREVCAAIWICLKEMR